ncbi:MAG: hypothetical protein EOO51_04050 [Flavobacterium sp.]|nr:MAG: hypothetical protein EOO51_04050 [Flavobacterium sp.]
MKNKFLALGLLAVAFAGCSKDDDPSIDYDQLNKKWYYDTTVVNGHSFPYDDNEECGKDYIQLLADGTYNDVDVFECNEYTDTGFWTREGNVITISDGVNSAQGTVKKLTSTRFEVKTTYDYDGDGNDDTVIERYVSTP